MSISSDDSDPTSLAKLFDLGTDENNWPRAELAEIFSLLLAAPLASEFVKVIPNEAASVRKYAESSSPPIITLADLLKHPRPGVELVEALQHFAEWHLTIDNSSLPSPVTKLLACSSIAMLLVLCEGAGADIDLDTARHGLRWAEQQEWAPTWLRELCGQANTVGDVGVARASMEEGQPVPRVPGYRVEGRLGEGGMGVVWRAVQKSTRRPVALKLIAPAAFGSERARLRFDREVELASRLEHPNIARVYHSGSHHGVCYYAMELVAGVHLDQYVRDQKLSVRRILELFRTVCEAVTHAHQRGVIHRDLKPSNVLITPDGQSHIVDFGLAKDLRLDDGGPPITEEGQHAGTPAFMSPEQAAGDIARIDTRSDVYSLGAMLFLLLAGDTPHDSHGSRYEVLRRIACDEPRNPRKLNKQIDAELESLLLKAVAFKPEERYGSVADLGKDIGRYLSEQPLAAKARSIGYLVRKWLRRHWAKVCIASIVTSAIVASVVIDAVRVRHERNAVLMANHALDASVSLLQKKQQELKAQERTLEIQMAESLVAQGDALSSSLRWLAAKPLYADAEARLGKLGLPLLPAEMGLSLVLQSEPPPIAELIVGDAVRDGLILTPNGRAVLLLPANDEPRILDILTGQTLAKCPVKLDRIRAMAFSRDSHHFVFATERGELRLLDLQQGTLVAALDDPEAGLPAPKKMNGVLVTEDRATNAMAISPDGQTILYGGGFGLRSWQLSATTGARALDTRSVDGNLAFLPDGQQFIRGTRNGFAVCAVADGRVMLNVITSERPSFDHSVLAVSADGNIIATAEWGGEIMLTSKVTGMEVSTLRGHAGSVMSLAFSPDGQLLASASRDRTAKLWDVRDGRLVRTFETGKASSGRPPSIALCEDGKTIAIQQADLVRMLPTADGEEFTVFQAAARGVTGASLPADGYLALIATADGFASAYDRATGTYLHTCDLQGGGRNVATIAPEVGRMLCDSGRRPRMGIDLWDIYTGQKLGSLDTEGRTVRGMLFSPDGTRAITGESDDRPGPPWDRPQVKPHHTYDLLTGKEVCACSGSVLANRSRNAWLADGRTVLSGAANHEGLLLWDAQTGEAKKTLRSEPVTALAVSPDDAVVLLCTIDGRVLRRTLQDDQPTLTLGAHKGSATEIRLFPDNRTAVSGGKDRALRIWDVITGRERRVLQDRVPVASVIAISPKGDAVLVGGEDGSVLFWDLSRLARYRDFASRLEAARRAILRNPNEPEALMAFGEWLVFRGLCEKGAEFLERAALHGAKPSHLTLARCHWQLNQLAAAKAEFEWALTAEEAPKGYLDVCIRAVDSSKSTVQTRPVTRRSQSD